MTANPRCKENKSDNYNANKKLPDGAANKSDKTIWRLRGLKKKG